MNRSITPILLSVAIVAGCNKQPSPESASRPVILAPPPTTNPAAVDSLKQENAPISDLFKVQLIKLVEETTKLDQMIAQDTGLAQIKAQIPMVKAPLESTRLIWPKGFATNALSDFDTAIHAWEFAIELSERVPKLSAKQHEIPNQPGYSADEIVLFLAAAETEFNPQDLKDDDNGYEEIAALGKEALVYWVYPDDFKMTAYRGKKFLPLRENIKVLEKMASSRLKSAREEVFKNFK